MTDKMKTKLDEKAIRFLEEQAPALAEAIMKQAYLETLASGNSVLEREGDTLYEIFPDGSKKEIKKLPPRIKVTPGQKITLS